MLLQVIDSVVREIDNLKEKYKRGGDATLSYEITRQLQAEDGW
jgi:hypothetical protein